MYISSLAVRSGRVKFTETESGVWSHVYSGRLFESETKHTHIYLPSIQVENPNLSEIFKLIILKNGTVMTYKLINIIKRLTFMELW